ncbi:BTAD domain-containing putative transcriptional regulator [Actinoplanes sp. NPDC051633]|uniref:BTAD domain-containing putative transcriptional regulator n=1 Tax=Actinoplanes sp. NPDC051633 TaxID=3155670 RepID=UPI003421ABB5
MRAEVGLLGPVELRLGGSPAPLPSASQRVVLARLALAGGRVVPVGDLIEALWGGEPPANAVGNLHSYVSRLRRLAGAELIRREPGGYRLDLPPDAVDAARAEALISTARGQRGPDAVATLAEALALWRGETLSDVADRQAFAPDLARLDELRRHAREEWLDRRLDAGQAAAALPEIEAFAAAEPFRERPCLLLMRALHDTGRTAEALAAARRFRERIADEHGLDPSPALDELQRRILTEEAIPPGPAPTPARTRPDRFFGRDAEMATLRAALRSGRLTTLAGPGGVGKTRLTTEILTGEELVVELAQVAVPADVATAVAGALGLQAAPRGGVEALAEHLGSRPAVLVLDNCEHLIEAVRRLTAAVLDRCPGVRVLATSRQPLGLPGERVLRLGPLPQADVVDLFCDRAALLRDGFADTAESRVLAAEICELVDGLPLAVELAARREAVFGMAHLRDRLGAGLTVLDPARGADRATGVRATVEWSYRLLDPAAQALLDRLAVCRGGFGLDGLAHLAPADLANHREQLLAELAEASLVVTDLTADRPRYRLLETVRHAGLAHLGPEREDEARAAHAEWMLSYVTDLLAAQAFRDPRTTPDLRRELANAQEALDWLVRTGRRDQAARLAAMLGALTSDAPHPAVIEQLGRLAPERVETESDALFALAAGAAAWLNSHFVVADRLLTAAIAVLGPDHPLHWSCRIVRASNAMFEGRVEDVRIEAVALAGDRQAPAWVAAMGVCCAALMRLYTGDEQGARRLLDEYEPTVAAARSADGFVAFTLGELASATDPAAAMAHFETSMRISDAIHHGYIGNIARVARAAVLIRTGSPIAAGACAEVLERVHAAGMTAQVWTVLRLVAELLAGLGEPDAAASIIAAADADPLAPAVMGPDLERHERLRIPGTRPPGPGDVPAVTEYALAALRQAKSGSPAVHPGAG